MSGCGLPQYTNFCIRVCFRLFFFRFYLLIQLGLKLMRLVAVFHTRIATPPPQFGGRIWPNLPNWSAELFGF